jgi:hypothetical protein
MKTGKIDFDKFTKAFLSWIDRFGLKGYQIIFHHKKLDHSYAEIKVDHEGKLAEVYFCTEWDDEESDAYKGPNGSAKHEAIHLLLSRLEYIARSRFIMVDDIREETESLVRILEKVLK